MGDTPSSARTKKPISPRILATTGVLSSMGLTLNGAVLVYSKLSPGFKMGCRPVTFHFQVHGSSLGGVFAANVLVDASLFNSFVGTHVKDLHGVGVSAGFQFDAGGGPPTRLASFWRYTTFSSGSPS